MAAVFTATSLIAIQLEGVSLEAGAGRGRNRPPERGMGLSPHP